MNKRDLLGTTSLGRKINNQYFSKFHANILNVNDFVSGSVDETLYPKLDSRDFIRFAESDNVLEQEVFIRKIFDLFGLEFIEGGYKPGCYEILEGGVIASIMHNCNSGILAEEWKVLCEKFLEVPDNGKYKNYFYKYAIFLFGLMFQKYKKIIP